MTSQPVSLQAALADTRLSLLNSVDATVAAQRERDDARAAIAAVHELLEGCVSEGQGFVPISAVRAALRLPDEKVTLRMTKTRHDPRHIDGPTDPEQGKDERHGT